MKKLFETHRDRLTDAEDRRMWGAIHDEVQGTRRAGARRWIPVGGLATVAAAVVVIALVRQGDLPTAGRDLVFDAARDAAQPAEVAPATPVLEDATENLAVAGEKSSESDLETRTDAPKEAGPSADDLGPRMMRVDGTLPEGQALGDADESEPRERVRATTPDGRTFESEATTPQDVGNTAGAAAAGTNPAPKAEAAPGRVAATPSSKMSMKSDTSPEPGVIRGRVTNEKGEPLPFANVILPGTDLGAATDAEGQFEIRGVPSGEAILRVLYMGYESVNDTLTIGMDGPLLAQDYRLKAAAAGVMNELLVTGRKELIRRESTASFHSEGQEELDRLPVDSFAEGVALKSGVVAQDGETQVRNERAGEGKKALSPSMAAPLPNQPPNGGYPVAVGGTNPVNGQPYDSMFFENYGTNPFVDPRDDRFATFAVDVDQASYTLTRSYLDRGSLPPKDAVRVEEFINSINHGYPAPGDALVVDRRSIPSEKGTFAIYLEAAPSPFGANHQLMRVGLKGRVVDPENRKPAVLTFLVDVSGSMGREDRLGLVKQSLRLLTEQMHPQDEVALVVYGSGARVILPHTSVEDRGALLRAIDSLVPEGATNAEAGLLEAYRLADRGYRRGWINRVILCSDGVANVGNTGADDILERIRREAGRGIELTTVGFGMGNYNDVLMEKLANDGEGNYYYVDTLDEARRVFVENLTGMLQTIARQVKIQVEFEPDAVRQYRILGYENRDVADKDFRNDAVDAGEVGAGHEVTALFEFKLEDRPKGKDVATVRIRYEDPETGKVTEEFRTLRLRDIHRDWRDAEPSFQLDAAVAEFAEILRHSYWAKDGDLAQAAGLARTATRELGNPQDALDMLTSMERAAVLWGRENPPAGAWDDAPDRR